MLLIVAALVSFVVFLGIFSYTMGVFDPKPEQGAEAAANSTGASNAPDAADTDGTQAEGTADGKEYYSPYGKAAAAVEKAQAAGTIDTMAELSLLERRQRELQAEQRTIERQKSELQSLKAQVEKLLAQKRAIDNEKITYIAKLLDGMKQEEMTGLMTNLDNKTIMAVLPNMKPQTASRVLALLPPKRAAKITTELLSSSDLEKR